MTQNRLDQTVNHPEDRLSSPSIGAQYLPADGLETPRSPNSERGHENQEAPSNDATNGAARASESLCEEKPRSAHSRRRRG